MVEVVFVVVVIEFVLEVIVVKVEVKVKVVVAMEVSQVESAFVALLQPVNSAMDFVSQVCRRMNQVITKRIKRHEG